MSPELTEAAKVLLAAANAYWLAAHRDKIYGAIIWLDDTDGNTIITTRDEYRQQLLMNIAPQDVTVFFDHVKDAE